MMSFLGLKTVSLLLASVGAGLPPELQRWLGPQDWQRDTDGPVLALGSPGTFDDTHVFAPCVALENGAFRMWYCGSRDSVAERVFRLGLATSENGCDFTRFARNPVYGFGDGKRSILTPALLRDRNGRVLREDGQLRMWFSATHFAGGPLHTLHETASRDGIHWAPPSPVLLENVYSPTILRDGDRYRMWYVDVSAEPWLVRYAESRDGREWRDWPEPVITIDQAWEERRLFYLAVVKADGAHLIWYGSYWAGHRHMTALGFAVSADGLHWHKHPDNPVLRPDPSRPWESHYTTSQTVIRLDDGTWRIWYASRTSPPHVNKYFAINTARWAGPATRPSLGD